MKDTWFTSDTHFGHSNILKYESEYRPFSSVNEMNEHLVEKWNSVVKPKDTIYHLGDFAFGRKNIKIAERLNGNKILILGNHDSYPVTEYLSYFNKVYGMKYWEKCILTHAPIHEYNFKKHYDSYNIEVPKIINVHGHLHSRSLNDSNYFNVSCEQNDLTPIHADVIRDLYRESCGVTQRAGERLEVGDIVYSADDGKLYKIKEEIK